jgi:WhiB family redox-sensing transcriptional regulator
MTTWHENASCRTGYDPTMWETPNSDNITKANEYAMAVCGRCPVRTACLTEALEAERGTSTAGRWHIWGGLTPEQRGQLDRGPKRKQTRGLVA